MQVKRSGREKKKKKPDFLIPIIKCWKTKKQQLLLFYIQNQNFPTFHLQHKNLTSKVRNADILHQSAFLSSVKRILKMFYFLHTRLVKSFADSRTTFYKLHYLRCFPKANIFHSSRHFSTLPWTRLLTGVHSPFEEREKENFSEEILHTVRWNTKSCWWACVYSSGQRLIFTSTRDDKELLQGCLKTGIEFQTFWFIKRFSVKKYTYISLTLP